MAAAVLVPLVLHREGPTVLLTRRSDHLKKHAGQISFPGGRVEPDDASLEAAALREAEEEIALPPNEVDVVGRLDDYLTGTGFQVTPIVGFVRPGLPLVPDPSEVSEILEVPLRFILDRRNHGRSSRSWNGTVRHYYEMPFGHHRIWGATAGMLVNLSLILAPEEPGSHGDRPEDERLEDHKPGDHGLGDRAW